NAVLKSDNHGGGRLRDKDEVGLQNSGDDDGFDKNPPTWLLDSSDHFTIVQSTFHSEANAQLCELFTTFKAMNTAIIFENWAAFQEAFYNLGMHLEKVKNRMGSSNAESWVSLRRKLEDESTSEFHEKDGSKTGDVIVDDGDDCETKWRKNGKLIDDNQFMKHPSKMVSEMIDSKLNGIGARIGRQKVTRKVGGIEQLSYIREFAKTLEQKLVIFFSIFDLKSLTSGKMTPSVWVKFLKDMLFVLDIVEHYSNIVATDETVGVDRITQGADLMEMPSELS
ncbi:hypothetical protein GIB67_017967, partial [Kingdonia uniflora]